MRKDEYYADMEKQVIFPNDISTFNNSVLGDHF
jgi:hypothetical protein